MFAFLDLKIEIMWTSYQFYYDMMEKIKKYISMSGNTYKILKNIDEYTDDTMLITDIASVINLFYAGKLEKLSNMKYTLIVGENIDYDINTFIGWDILKTSLNFSDSNLLVKIFKNSKKITYQNNKLKLLFDKLDIKNTVFFPIDGYLPEYLIPNPDIIKDIDVLYYGAMCYNRRIEAVKNLTIAHPKFGQLKTVICNNVFDLNNLISRSKIIFHVNSMDNCYHVPYAKIMRLLSNNKIVVTEMAEEFKTSNLSNFVHTFNYYETGKYKGTDLPSYMILIRNIIDNYEEEQYKLNTKNPQKFLQNYYNFNFNVAKLLDIEIK